MQYRWDDFVLDGDAYRLERSGSAVPLEPKAFDVLLLLVARAGRLVTKQEIFDAVWRDTAVTDHALTRVVAQLRRTLGDEAREAKYIETIPTRGYRWVRPLAPPPAALPEPATATATATITAAPPPPAVDHSSPPQGNRTVRRPGAMLALTAATVLLVGALVAIAVVNRGAAIDAAASPDAARVPDADIKWPVQVTTSPGLDLHPAFSPQGDALAYASDRSGTLEIFVRAMTGDASETPLTSDGQQNVQPAWSPDGSRIAYHSASRGGIWVVPARGGTPRQIVPVGSHPAWSPDGTRLAYQSDEVSDVTPSAFGAQAGSTIFVVNADGSGSMQITTATRPAGGHAAPIWSPDGRRIAFTTFEAGADGGAWTVDVQTREVRHIVQSEVIYELAYAPDGRALYASAGEPVVLKLPLDPATGASAGRAELLPIAGVPAVRGITISADGRRLAFAGMRLTSQIWLQPVARDGSPSGAARPVTSDSTRRTSLPVISPDGSRIAYMSSRVGQPPNVWVVGLDGSSPTQITTDEAGDAHPNWYPDSQRVAYFSNRNNTPGLWFADITTRREELLFDARRMPPNRMPNIKGSVAEWRISPTFKYAAFVAFAPPAGNRVVYITPLDRMDAQPLTTPDRWVGYPAWSPDERFIAGEIKEGSSTHLGIIDVQSRTLRQLTNDRGQTWVRSWSPDGRRIAAAAYRNGRWDLRWIDVASGAHGTITPAGPTRTYVRYPDWSPRGDLIAYERGELAGNIWTLAIK